MRSATLIIDLQYGSTGKGLLAGYLAQRERPDTVVAALGANAGHTYIGPDGHVLVHRMLPIGVVSPALRLVLIGPGAVIDPVVLLDEIESRERFLAGRDEPVFIHENAAVITPLNREAERGWTAIGSTQKGVGAAQQARIARSTNPDQMNIAREALRTYPKLHRLCVSATEYARLLSTAERLQIESAQGFGLSIYHGFYPFTTSRDCTPMQVMADCGVPLAWPVNVVGCLRTYPIRVANRFAADGTMVGTSGPCYPDQEEISWDELGIEPELTTVTKLPRRVFTFSYQQLQDAVVYCRPNRIFCNFMNYLKPAEAHLFVSQVGHTAQVLRSNILLGYGPTDGDIQPA